ncbi:MAG: hypothetical protein ACI8TQ_000552 [Planctomycetota bacterium]|jgi:hypothetical protein
MSESNDRSAFATWQLVGLFTVACMSVLSLFLPARGPVGEGLQEFSAERAFKHVEAIAKVPHPAGSPEQVVVRQELLERLRELGVEPEITEFEAKGLKLSNLLVHVPGEQSMSTVLLAAH